ncbi:hypothetical protein, partial [Fangia hongkongensis]
MIKLAISVSCAFIALANIGQAEVHYSCPTVNNMNHAYQQWKNHPNRSADFEFIDSHTGFNNIWYTAYLHQFKQVTSFEGAMIPTKAGMLKFIQCWYHVDGFQNSKDFLVAELYQGRINNSFYSGLYQKYWQAVPAKSSCTSSTANCTFILDDGNK